MYKLYKKSDIQDYIKLVFDRMLTLPMPERSEVKNGVSPDMCNWYWPQGVGLYAMFRYYECTKDESTLKFITDWFDNHIKKGIGNIDININSTMPMMTMALVYDLTQDKKYYDIIKNWVEFVMNNFPRTEQNGFQSCEGNVKDKYYFECTRSQLWINTTFMLILFLAKAGRVLGEKKYIEEAERQLLLHIKYLTDKKTGLCYHVWSFDGRTNFTKALWARGNCWYTACMVDIMEYFQMESGTKLYLIDSFLDQIKALKRFQHEDGAWSTLVDQMDTYKETSGTAGFCYGILKGVRTEIIPEEYHAIGLKALSFIIDNITSNGDVRFVSAGTGLSRWDINHYKTIRTEPRIYGQALTALALTEALWLAE